MNMTRKIFMFLKEYFIFLFYQSINPGNRISVVVEIQSIDISIFIPRRSDRRKASTNNFTHLTFVINGTL
jgi:hypothetical protein